MKRFHAAAEQPGLSGDPSECLQPSDLLENADSSQLWRSLASANLDREHLAQRRVVTLGRTDTAHFPFDILRTRTLKTLRENNWTSIAVTSPTPECGKTVVSLNLAFSLSHLQDCRTALLDLDLRKPQIANVLGLSKTYSMQHFLEGKSTIEESFVLGGRSIAVGPNSSSVPNAAELLQGPTTAPVLADLKSRLRPDIIIYDLPPVLVNDDVLAFLPNVDCVLVVAATGASTFNDIDLCESILAKHTNILGIVLNKCQYGSERYGY